MASDSDNQAVDLPDKPRKGRPKGSWKDLPQEEARKNLKKLLLPHVQAIARALIEKAKKGDIAAAREVFDRVAGKVTEKSTKEDDKPDEMSVKWLE